MDVKIEPTWKKQLAAEFEQPYFIELTEFVRKAYKTTSVFPPASLIFNAFDHTSFTEVKVVILGQDPYHGPGQAHGLCFSVPENIPHPPSLKNIFKELADDYGITKTSGDLTAWADQGVFLLNATLTVEAHQAGSHQNKGWEQFTDHVISTLSSEKDQLIFILWGGYARQKKRLIDQSKHHIIESPHPSPLSSYRGFFGSKPFSRTNAQLKFWDKKEINW